MSSGVLDWRVGGWVVGLLLSVACLVRGELGVPSQGGPLAINQTVQLPYGGEKLLTLSLIEPPARGIFGGTKQWVFSIPSQPKWGSVTSPVSGPSTGATSSANVFYKHIPRGDEREDRLLFEARPQGRKEPVISGNIQIELLRARLEVQPANVLNFEAAPAGVVTRAALRVVNRGGAPLDAVCSVAPPFRVAQETLSLRAGESGVLECEVLPVRPGALDAWLEVQWREPKAPKSSMTRVALRAMGVAGLRAEAERMRLDLAKGDSVTSLPLFNQTREVLDVQIAGDSRLHFVPDKLKISPGKRGDVVIEWTSHEPGKHKASWCARAGLHEVRGSVEVDVPAPPIPQPLSPPREVLSSPPVEVVPAPPILPESQSPVTSVPAKQTVSEIKSPAPALVPPSSRKLQMPAKHFAELPLLPPLFLEGMQMQALDPWTVRMSWQVRPGLDASTLRLFLFKRIWDASEKVYQPLWKIQSDLVPAPFSESRVGITVDGLLADWVYDAFLAQVDENGNEIARSNLLQIATPPDQSVAWEIPWWRIGLGIGSVLGMIWLMKRRRQPIRSRFKEQVGPYKLD